MFKHMKAQAKETLKDVKNLVNPSLGYCTPKFLELVKLLDTFLNYYKELLYRLNWIKSNKLVV